MKKCKIKKLTINTESIISYDIASLYDDVGLAAGFTEEQLVEAVYDCTKIEISDNIQNRLIAVYKESVKTEDDPNPSIQPFITLLLVFGPKVSNALKGGEVFVHDGWIDVPASAAKLATTKKRHREEKNNE